MSASYGEWGSNAGKKTDLPAEAAEIRRLMTESTLESLGLASGLLEDLTKEIQYALENGIVHEPSDLRMLLRELNGLQTLAEQGAHLATGQLQALLGPAIDCFGGRPDLDSRTARIQVQA